MFIKKFTAVLLAAALVVFPVTGAAAAESTAAGNGKIVCIDAGHQAKGDSTTEPVGPGASTVKAKVAGGTHGTTTGIAESELTLAVALKLQSILTARGYTVVMCRTSQDVNISNAERAQIANAAGANAFIRLHANGVASSAANGVLALAPTAANPYCPQIAASSQALSAAVVNGQCAATGQKNKGVQLNDTMSGINWSQVPVTILEMGFMTNPTEDLNMANDNYRTLMATGIANGIDAYFASVK